MKKFLVKRIGYMIVTLVIIITGQIHNGTIWNFYEESDYER